MIIEEKDRQRFDANPTRFVAETIKNYIVNSPDNRLEAFQGTPIFDEPLVGFADGDDPLFQQYLHRQWNLLQQSGREEGYIGRYAGCGLCQTKVPCEEMIPASENNQNGAR
jgi:hypothetical protein